MRSIRGARTARGWRAAGTLGLALGIGVAPAASPLAPVGTATAYAAPVAPGGLPIDPPPMLGASGPSAAKGAAQGRPGAVAPGGPRAVGPVDPHPAAATRLHLTVTASDDAVREADLTCEPAGGTHPAPERACAELTAAGGDIDALGTAAGTVCPMVYDPVTVTMSGHWRGTAVVFERIYGNPCELAGHTGSVFAF